MGCLCFQFYPAFSPTDRDKLVCLAGVLFVTFERLSEYCLIVFLIIDIVIIAVINTA